MTADIEVPYTLVESEVVAVDLFSELSGLSRSRVKDAMTKGAAWIESNGRPQRLRRAKRSLQPGDKIALYYSARVLNAEAPAPALLADHESFSVWIKPAGLMSSGSRYGDHCAIDRAVERELDRPTFLVHRLDRFAWGIMVLAHHRQAAANLAAQFEQRSVRKIYHAVVAGKFTEALDLNSPVDGKNAISHIRPIEQGTTESLVEVIIETGRKHQIRYHLAEAGFPIVGDRQYGSSDARGLQLAAVALELASPETEERQSFKLPAALLPRLSDGTV